MEQRHAQGRPGGTSGTSDSAYADLDVPPELASDSGRGRTLSLRVRIALLPIVSTLLFAIGIVSSILIAAETSGTIRALGQDAQPFLTTANAIEQELESLAWVFQSAAIEGDEELLTQASAHVDDIAALIERLSRYPIAENPGESLGKLLSLYSDGAMRTVRAMSGTDLGIDPSAAVDAMQRSRDELHALAHEAVAIGEREFASVQQAAQRGVTRNLQVLIASAIGIVALLVALSWTIIGSIWRDLGGEPHFARKSMQLIATGDLTGEVRLRAGDRRSVLASLVQMQAGLRRIVGEVRLGTTAIAEASAEIAAGHRDLSHRSESQVESITETAVSLSELTELVRKNADYVRDANELAGSAVEVARRGGAAMADIVETMDGIQESSERIAKIIGVINSIAFQTNILALNASVESARAGEHGRGFAVVASEVRALAHSASDAAREIATLIATSSERVGLAGDHVRETGSTILEVVDAVERVTRFMSEIAESSNHQASRIESVDKVMRKMDDSTRLNSAMVEESVAAAASMTEQCRQLEALVASFRLQAISADAPRHVAE